MLPQACSLIISLLWLLHRQLLVFFNFRETWKVKPLLTEAALGRVVRLRQHRTSYATATPYHYSTAPTSARPEKNEVNCKIHFI